MRAFIVVGTIVAGLALSPVSSNGQVSATLSRSSRTDSAKRSGCKIASLLGTGGNHKFVSVEGYLNSSESRVTVKPNETDLCRHNMWNHYVTASTTCWNGQQFPDSWNGTAQSKVNRGRSCGGLLQGGRGMMFYMEVR
jgi:hypothetical protein